MRTITVTGYQAQPGLDQELATLGYTAIRGWPDQRPITPGLVRSRLRPPTPETSTIIASCRDTSGQLIGAAAVRPPADPGKPGRLWGPVVHPHHQRSGIGRRLLAAVTSLPTMSMVTAEIPARQAAACQFFNHAGWRPAGEAFLLKRPLPTLMPGVRTGWRISARAARHGELLRHAVADLITRTTPERAGPDAAGAYTRWTSDERFTPECLQLAWHDRRLVGAALAYPLRHTVPDEPAEALLAELVVPPDIAEHEHIGTVLTALALNAAAAAGDAEVARSIQADSAPLAVLEHLGFSHVDTIRQYRWPS